MGLFDKVKSLLGITPEGSEDDGFVLNYKTKVAELRNQFNEKFGSVLRVYGGRSQLDDNLTLKDAGLSKEGKFECRGNMHVGSFITRMFEEYGLQVKVYTVDECVTVIDNLTLTASGFVKKNATKKDMENMLSDKGEINEEALDWSELLWTPVKEELLKYFDVKMKRSGNYAWFDGNACRYVMCYIASRNQAKVYLETQDGEAAKNVIDAKVASAPVDHILKQTILNQSSRNKDKFTWVIENKIDKSEGDLIKWYAETLIAFYKFMESAGIEIESSPKNDNSGVEQAPVTVEEDALILAKEAAEKAKVEAEVARKAAEEELRILKEEADKARAKAEKEVAEARAAAEKAKAEAKAVVDAVKTADKPAAKKAGKKDGELPGVFTLKDGRKICFSQGNLQFNPKKYEFRFAKEQYETLGQEANEKCAPSYDGWIDIFGWGTSGYMGCQPTEDNPRASDYGPASGDLTGDNANYDWGVYNAIVNGGNKEGLWRTPTPDEMNYLLKERPNAAKLKLECYVCGKEGFMLMPDDFWTNRLRFAIDITSNESKANNFDAEQWKQLEAMGVVFFPVHIYKYIDSPLSRPLWSRWWNTRVNVLTSRKKFMLSYVDVSEFSYFYKSTVRLVKDIR